MFFINMEKCEKSSQCKSIEDIDELISFSAIWVEILSESIDLENPANYGLKPTSKSLKFRDVQTL